LLNYKFVHFYPSAVHTECSIVLANLFIRPSVHHTLVLYLTNGHRHFPRLVRAWP